MITWVTIYMNIHICGYVYHTIYAYTLVDYCNVSIHTNMHACVYVCKHVCVYF